MNSDKEPTQGTIVQIGHRGGLPLDEETQGTTARLGRSGGLPLDEEAQGTIAGLGHNGGPPLDDEHVPEWGSGPIGNYFDWKRARRAARNVSQDIAFLRLERAERLGLTYEEYSLEILERGRYLQAEDVKRIADIKNARRMRPVQT